MSIDVKLINAFLESLLHILYTMAQTEASHKTPTLKTDTKAKGDITGLISMVGTHVTGSIAISFCEDTILEIAKRKLGVEVNSVDHTITDLVEEITSMVTDGAKKILDESGHAFEMTSPEVISGSDHEITHKTNDRVIQVPFQSSSGILYVEFSFQNSQ